MVCTYCSCLLCSFGVVLWEVLPSQIQALSAQNS